MSKYIKLKRAELELGSMSMLDGKIFVEDALAKISNLPTIDIVHCKECVWRYKDNQDDDYCTYVKGLADIGEESFCSWGERKED